MVIAPRSGLLLARLAASRSWTRSILPSKTFTTSRVLLDDGVLTTSNVKVKKPIGGFRGGFFGFLLGLTVAGGLGYGYLLEEYRTASSLLLSSVEELMQSTKNVTENVRKIEMVERELAKLKAGAATKEDIEQLKKDSRKLYDGANLDQLELKTHVWGMEQDLHTLLKDKATTIRLGNGNDEKQSKSQSKSQPTSNPAETSASKDQKQVKPKPPQ